MMQRLQERWLEKEIILFGDVQELVTREWPVNTDHFFLPNDGLKILSFVKIIGDWSLKMAMTSVLVSSIFKYFYLDAKFIQDFQM